MNKLIALLLTLVLLAGLIPCAGCAEDKTLTVVTTIFPIYDWVRQIAGEDAEIRLSMLLDNGVDLHSYQPSAQDILNISAADLFIYVGGENDEWVEGVLAAVKNRRRVLLFTRKGAACMMVPAGVLRECRPERKTKRWDGWTGSHRKPSNTSGSCSGGTRTATESSTRAGFGAARC